jgi:hypothetical protein
MKALAAVSLFASLLVLAPQASQAQMGVPTEAMGNPYKDDAQRAADHYARGARAKRKAEEETDPGKKEKLYARAKAELEKSAGLHANYDAFLALGQIHLALGNKESAFNACGKALALKPADERAKSCVEEAAKKSQ